MNNKKIFIFGGTGSLGNKLIERYIDTNTIINYSRDECKQWELELRYPTKTIKNIIGDINNYDRVKQSLLREQPNIIIIAAAMKHIDRCEYASDESLRNNLMGIKNILDCIENEQIRLNELETVLFVSTDKACSPINIYGMCKALSEKLTIEKSYYMKRIKFVCVRYGNVLNSRGSIIPILHEKGTNKDVENFSLTDETMTRFIMTLEESCELIEYAILKGDSGDIVIPKLKSMLIADLFKIFSEMYNKPVKVVGIRVGEKIHESLINDTQSLRVVDSGKYYHIKSNYDKKIYNYEKYDYNSGIEQISKEELKEYLEGLQLF